jgi:hypothetical protein
MELTFHHSTQKVVVEDAIRIEALAVSVFGVLCQRPRHGSVATLDEAELRRCRDVEVAVFRDDLGNDIQAVPHFPARSSTPRKEIAPGAAINLPFSCRTWVSERPRLARRTLTRIAERDIPDYTELGNESPFSEERHGDYNDAHDRPYG